MNKEDRKSLSHIVELLEEALSGLTEMSEAEREKYDNMPEGLQKCERGQAIDEAATCLEDQASALQDIVDELNGYAE
jgi:hypothetical protein